MRRSATVVALFLLAAPLASGASADGERPESTAWDVIEQRTMAVDEAGQDEAFMWNPATDGLLPHARDLVGFARGGDLGCHLLVLSTPQWVPKAWPVPACDVPGGIGTSVVTHGLAVGCTLGTAADRPVAVAVDIASGQTVWTLSPQDAGGPAGVWGCGRSAVVGDAIVMPLWGRVSPTSAGGLDGEEAFARLVKLDARDGTLEWSQQVSGVAMMVDAAGVYGYDDLLEAPLLQPLAVAVAGEGYVVTASLGEERVLLQVAPSGEFRGILRQSASPYGRPGISFSQTAVDTRDAEAAVEEAWGAAPGHIHAASDGSVAYVAWGQTFLAVDAFVARPLASLGLDPPLGNAHPFLGPRLVAGGVVVPMTYGVALVDPTTMTVLWDHAFPQVFLGGVWDVAVAADGKILVLADDTRSRIQLHVLDADSGATLLQLPVPVAPSERFFTDKLHVEPFPDGTGALVWDRAGAAALLGIRTDAPAVGTSSRYPDLHEPVTAGSTPPSSGMRGHVAWGDSAVTYLAPDETVASHSYRAAGPHTIRWTWQDPESGATWTSSTVVDVGGAPPARLSVLQQAFAPENSEMTWGVTGLILAFFSGIGAYAFRVWQRRGIGRDLQQLEALRLQSADDPVGAMHGLRLFARSLRQRAAAGKLESGEFIPLSHEALALSTAVRQRVLSRFDGRIGPRLRLVVEAALADGVLTPAERTGILAGLDGEMGLAVAERASFRRLLSEWS